MMIVNGAQNNEREKNNIRKKKIKISKRLKKI